MSDKNSKTITVSEFKEGLRGRLNSVAEKLDSHDRMRIAINLKIELVTVKRYMDGNPTDLRRIELAEKILCEAEIIAMTKTEGLSQPKTEKAVA